MEHKNNHNSSGNSFLLGVIVGGIATLLFTTKKGREIARDLAEKGLQKFSELQDNMDEAIVAEEVEENDYIEPVKMEPVKLAKEARPNKVPVQPKPSTAVKRFFRLKKKN